ncbi:SPFH domain-containing protein [Candidatus Entotheonella palauensis]|uniref:SPFH domain-containing protein n=1 Tax=Candidatus Entotheonella palauensis TaxID=93172 RepID=UPI0015C43899|nr:prohibitin family protein [Candidatus Entotheonella palauensis]
MFGHTGIIGNLDSLLQLLARVSWVVFTLYATYSFVTVVRNRGLRFALLRLFSFRILVPLVVVVAISLLSAALIFVYPQQAAVIVSLVSPSGVRPQPVRAGLHWIFPFLENEARYPIYWQTYTMSHIATEGAVLGDDSIRARTSDGQEVRLSSSVIFRLDFEHLVSIHIDWQDRYVTDLVRPVIRGVVRSQVSQFTVREVNSNERQDLEIALSRLLRVQFMDKGLIMDQFLLRDINFAKEFATAIEHKQVALEREQQTLYEAQQRRNLAQGEADAIRIKAEAQAKAVELVAEALKVNPDILTYRYIDKLSPNIRAMLVPSGTPLILPTPNLDDAPNLETSKGEKLEPVMQTMSPQLPTSITNP